MAILLEVALLRKKSEEEKIEEETRKTILRKEIRREGTYLCKL